MCTSPGFKQVKKKSTYLINERMKKWGRIHLYEFVPTGRGGLSGRTVTEGGIGVNPVGSTGVGSVGPSSSDSRQWLKTG